MKGSRFLTTVFAALALCACSTTRSLPEGEYRLAENEIRINGDSELKSSDVSAYVKQQAASWTPFLYVYNWGGHSDNFLARIFRKIGKAPVVYNPDLVYSSAENIGRHLEYLGYYGSRITAHVDTAGRNIAVTYNVTPGKRYRIDEIRYELPDYGSFAEEFMADSSNVTIHVGDYLSEQSLEAETARGAGVFRNMGYYSFNKSNYFFEADTITKPGRTVLKYSIHDYARGNSAQSAQPLVKYSFGDVSISYPKTITIREKALRHLNLIKPGDTYNEKVVGNTYNRLSSIKVFNGVGIEMTPSGLDKVDCSINLSQSQVQGFKANLEASTNSTGLMGVSPQVNYYHKNIFHGGEWLNIGLMGNFQFKFDDSAVHSNEWGISSSLSFPKFLGLPYRVFKGPSIPRTEIKAAYNYQNRPEFTRNVASASYGYTGAIKGRLFYQIYPVTLSYVSLYNLDAEFSKTLDKIPYMKYSYQDHFDSGLAGMVYYTTNADIVPKTSYHYERLSLDLSGNLVSILKPVLRTNASGQGMILGAPYSQYIRGELTLGRTLHWGSENAKKAVAARLVMGAGYAYGNSTALPYEKQFYCGGASSMRGWQARALGPGLEPMNETFSIPSQTGDMKFEADLEYRTNFFWKVDGAAFVEVGNVWNLQYDNNFLRSLAADWGIGFRVDLDFILLRIDAGFKVHDPSRKEGHRWLTPDSWLKKGGHAVHFGVGYPF